VLETTAIEQLFARLAALDPAAAAEAPAKVGADPFRSLVNVMLSAQSRDAMTARASAQLFAVAATPEAILALDERRLAELIRDAGLYIVKARNIRRMCAALLERHRGVVPRTRSELLALPGVGRKSADILLRFIFDEPVVAVDTHVFRVATRTGLAQGRTEAQVAAALEQRIPERWRRGAHLWLLELGKRCCTPRRPRCSSCAIAELCERNGIPGRT
jgi:endonuclease-3